MRIRQRSTEKVELLMTPMIDIVFQLLIFFIMSFKIQALEGDFNIKMPLANASQSQLNDQQSITIKVRMQSAPTGELAGVSVNGEPLQAAGWPQELQAKISRNQALGGGPGTQDTTEVELDCDYNLRYEEVIRAVTAISGYVTDDGKIVTLVEKIRFAPPKSPN